MIPLLIFLFFSPCARLFISGLYIYMCPKVFLKGCSQKNPFLHGCMLKKS